MNEPYWTAEPGKAQLLELIDRSARGKYIPMIKTLMAMFGFNASQRVRQSSLAEVTRTLTEWGIGHEFPAGTSSNDYIRLFRMTPENVAQVRAISTRPPPSEGEYISAERISPFELVFQVGDAVEDARSRALANDLFAAIWSSQPVLLFVDGSDEFFALAGGYVAAIMRRRDLMIRGRGWGSGPAAPEVLSPERLKRALGQLEGTDHGGGLPQSGGVYLLRDAPDDVQDDERVALARELLMPHTYRIRARFEVTTAEPGLSRRAVDDPRFVSARAWVAAFAGMPATATEHPLEGLFDLSSMLAEATQIRDALIQRATWDATDPAFQAGFESTEHMVLKNMAIRHLRARCPEDALQVERSVWSAPRGASRQEQDEASDEMLDGEDRVVHARPDVRCPGRVSVEVETFRSLVLPGSSPFFALEQKLRRKLSAYSEHELWLVVPNDVAMLAEPQLHAMIRNLQQARPELQVRLATMDLVNSSPMFISPSPVPRTEVRLLGASWREPRKDPHREPLTWNDVAGYSDLKTRLQQDVLAPLHEPARYAQYKLAAPNGILLYGLPGCGKSYIGRVLAGEANLVCRRIAPSDLTGWYLGEGTMKTRELFDWALKQSACLIILDELDAIAPQRAEGNMHTDEKRQVNELLTQLDRIVGKPVVVVGTTNYFRGIDAAIRRSGRFDQKIPVFPPNEPDRKGLFDYYLGPRRLAGVEGAAEIDTLTLARATPLFAPADIKVAVETVARRSVLRSVEGTSPRLDERELLEWVRVQPRSIQANDARKWVEEAAQELGPNDDGLRALREEIERAYGRS